MDVTPVGRVHVSFVRSVPTDPAIAMNPVSLLLLGLAMSADAFAAAIAKGAGMSRPRWSQALRIGLIFGVVEALTPVIGWALGSAASRYIEAWDHWIAFVLLGALGIYMLYKSTVAQGSGNEHEPAHHHGVVAIALAGLATSIDAMAVGVGLAFVDVNIALVAAVIGVCTFTMVTVGVMAGRALGELIGRRAEAAGGAILILVGAAILVEHLSPVGA